MNFPFGISTIIFIMVAIVIGVNLIPAIFGVINSTVDEPVLNDRYIEGEDKDSALADKLAGILPIVFIVIVVLGIVAWEGGWYRPVHSSNEQEPVITTNEVAAITSKARALNMTSNEVLNSMRFKLEGFPFDKFGQPLRLSREGVLTLRTNLAWIIAEKHPNHNMYQFVGVARNRTSVAVYVVGRDSHTNTPYSMRLPPGYATRSIEECIRWCMEVEKTDKVTEV